MSGLQRRGNDHAMRRHRTRHSAERHLPVCRGWGNTDEGGLGGIVGHERHRVLTHRHHEVRHSFSADLHPSQPSLPEGEHRADRDDIHGRWDAELKATLNLAIRTETFPPLFGRQVGADPSVRHGLSRVVYHRAFQPYPGVQSDVENGVLGHRHPLQRLVREVLVIHINLVGPHGHAEAVVAGRVCQAEADLLIIAGMDGQIRPGRRLAVGAGHLSRQGHAGL